MYYSVKGKAVVVCPQSLMPGRLISALLVCGVLAAAESLVASQVQRTHRQPSRPLVVKQRPPPIQLAASTAQPSDNAKGLAVGWGVCGFLGILASAIGRLAPIAAQPFVQKDLSVLQWGMYACMMVFFAYAEGYKAFQLKFSPLVVQRAMTLKDKGTTITQLVFAPFYSMGLFHASPKRRKVITDRSLLVHAATPILPRSGMQLPAALAPDPALP